MSEYNTYVINDELFVSVSTILNTEGAGFLIPWALKKFSGYQDYQNFMDQVSDIGSRIHAYVECDLKGEPFPDWKLSQDILPAIERWHEFKKENKIKMIACERVVSSLKYRYAGTCDLIIELNDQLYIADLKTGSVQPKAFTQIMAYKSAFLEEPKKDRIENIKDAKPLIINLHREGKPVELHTLDSMYNGEVSENDELGLFHALRYIWYMRNVKSRKFKPVIKNMQAIISPYEKRFKENFKI